MGCVEALGGSPVVLGTVAVVALVAWGGWQLYQFCPHCGALTRRVQHGWLRCRRCGRQYRRGLRLR
jgi:hypothetical protein